VDSTWSESVTAIQTAMKTEITPPVQFHILLLSLSHGNRALKTNFTELPILTVNYKDAVHMSVPDVTIIRNARYSQNRRLNLEATQTADNAIGLCAAGSLCDNFQQK